MQHDEQKEKLEASLIGKIFCMETLIFLMGCLSLVYGIANGKGMSIFWGVTILLGFLALRQVRKRDWKKHWEDLEREQQQREKQTDKPQE